MARRDSHGCLLGAAARCLRRRDRLRRAIASARPARRRRRQRGLKIAMIAKSSTNPVFLSARTGAEAAAKELSPEARRDGRDRLAHAADRGRPGAGAAHRAGGERGRERRS